MEKIVELIGQLANISVHSTTGDTNAARRGIEAQLSSACTSLPLTTWLPSFLGSLPTGSASNENAMKVANAPSGFDCMLSEGFGTQSTSGPSAESFIAASYLSDFMLKNGKAVLAQSKGASVGMFCGSRLCALAFEVAVLTAGGESPQIPSSQLNWLRKLATTVTYCVQNNTSELRDTVRCLTEFVHFAMDQSGDVAALVSSLPFLLTNTAAARLKMSVDFLCLRSCVVAASILCLHVVLKVASDKKMSQKALKNIQMELVGPSLITGEWVQEVFFRVPGGLAAGCLSFNALAQARVFLLKLCSRTLKVVLSASSFPSNSGSSALFSCARSSAVLSTQLTAEAVAGFVVNGFGSMLTQFASTTLPAMVSVVSSGGSAEHIADPLAFRANYFVLKAFHRILTDSYDGAVGSWTAMISPEVCGGSIVSSMFSILMMLPSVSACEGVSISFGPSSSCPDFDVVGHFEKLFFLCAGSIQHICSMDESASYYASVLQAVFPSGPNSMSLATSVIRRILTEYLRDDNGLREGAATGDFRQRLLAQWQSDPEKHFEELELLNDGDTSEGAAEQLFTSLTGSTSCRLPLTEADALLGSDLGKALFPEAAWRVVNEMLQETSASESERELSKLMAYRAIGLGHYTLSAGQEDNYRAFFYNSLMPEMQSGATTPLIQRRAIWCAGMWCESATASMRQDFFKGLSTLLTTSGSTLNPVILLTALKALEHFTNDLNFDVSHLPEGFVPMLFGGLKALFPVIRSPTVLQNVCGLVFVLVSKCGAIAGVGDVMIEMLTPAVVRFVEEISQGEVGGAQDSDDRWDDGGWDDEDDATGEVVGAVRIILETLNVAMYSSASDPCKWTSPMTQPLLALLKLLTDPFDTQGNSGYFQSMLEDDAWCLWGALIRTTSTEFLAAPHVLALIVQSLSYALSSQMAERDFESKGVYLRFVLATWLTLENFAAAGGSGDGLLECLSVSRGYFQQFAETTISEAMSTADEDLLLVAIQAALLLVALPATTSVSGPVFMKSASDFFFGNADSDLEASACSPSMLSLLSYTLPRCVPKGTPSPSGLADKVNAIADVTTSRWSLARIAMFVGYCTSGGNLNFGDSPRDVDTLLAVAETCCTQLRDMAEEDGIAVDASNPYAYSGELIAEALGDESRTSPHTSRLHQLLCSL